MPAVGEDRFRILSEASFEALIIHENGIIIDANRVATDSLGYEYSEIIGQPLTKFAAEEYHDTILNNVMRDYPEPYEAVAVRKDGSRFPVEARGRTIRQGARVLRVSAIRDITDRKRAEAARREIEALTQALIASSLDIAVLFDADGTIVDMNETAAKSFGRSRTELLGTNGFLLVSLEVEALRRVWVMKTIEGKKPVRFEDEREGRWFDSCFYPIFDDRGEVFQLAVIARDITQQKRLEETLRDSEENYRLLVGTLPDAVIAADLEGTISYVSDRALELNGYASLDELVGKSALVFLAPEEHERARINIERTVADGFIRNVEYRMLRKDGSVFIGELNASLMRDARGNPKSFLATVRDITDRKRAEEQIRHYGERLEAEVEQRAAQIRDLERQRSDNEKLAATGRMAAGIAHEINNPLAGIKNSFRLVKKAIPENHKYFEYVSRIEKEIDRIALIVHRVFDLYRPDQHTPRQFRIDDSIRHVIGLLETSCEDRGITFSVSLPETPTVVTLPEGYVFQILFNIIQNAVEATDRDGDVDVRLRTSDESIVIEVSDQGPGIPEDIRERIFEPFFTTKGRQVSGGLGLGLSVSKGMVQAMGGSLNFDTVVGEGTVFRITLPRGSNG